VTLGDDALIEAAAECSRWVAKQPLDSPDLFNGAAGRLRFHLAVAQIVRDGGHLRVACKLGEWLLARAQSEASGGLRWQIPAGFGPLSGARQTGYAHGAAGIGDALLDLFEVTHDERFLDGARGAIVHLEHLAMPALGDRSGLDWPADESDAGAEPGAPVGRIGPFWCHGAAGIARFMFHAAAIDSNPEVLELARRAALTAGRGARWSALCQCHGVFGNIECLVDAYQATGERRFIREARPMLDFVINCAIEPSPGALVWPFDSPTNYTPDLMVGFSGAASCLLRVADPEPRPHLLSLSGLARMFDRPPAHDDPRQP
jgi:lantibiotic modifying enzyme